MATPKSTACPEAPKSDFIPAKELAALLACSHADIWNQHSSGRGAVAPLLVKVGGRVGAWRQDYELWRDAQRRVKNPAETRSVA